MFATMKKFLCLLLIACFLQTMCDSEQRLQQADQFILRADPVARRNDDNYGPVIGISAQLVNPDDPTSDSYIAASYVKYLESAGARVVPIPASWSEDQLRALFPKLSGYFLPGGSAHMLTSGYYHHAQLIFDLAREAYDEHGDYFPIWGTCLGFETLNVLVAGGDVKVLGHSDSTDILLPLDFTADVLKSRLFKDAPREILDDLINLSITYNFHQECVTLARFEEDARLNSFFSLLSTNKDKNGQIFVSTVEAKNYPIFATQWHPEKNPFEWSQNLTISHTTQAVRTAQFLANFFVNECRKSTHQFPSDELQKYIIYNFNPEFSGKLGSHFVQRYLFK